ncbi:MAG: hypothetical protein DRN33_03620 [Thermoplasmata archaeon]|nr:MAG: hypothetical protein DRN33_03620 [Thermoplasmata archaeon]
MIMFEGQFNMVYLVYLYNLTLNFKHVSVAIDNSRNKLYVASDYVNENDPGDKGIIIFMWTISEDKLWWTKADCIGISNCRYPDITAKDGRVYVVAEQLNGGVICATTDRLDRWDSWEINQVSVSGEWEFPSVSAENEKKASSVSISLNDLYEYHTDDGGTTWECNGRSINDESTVVEQYHSADVKGFYAVWTDIRNRDKDVYFDSTLDQPPSKPIVNGPTSGKIGEEYTYTAVATDPEGDDVCYLFDWGDITAETLTDYVDSGEEVSVSHVWYRKGSYTIRVRAEDTWGAKSEWATLKVSMPFSKNKILLSQYDKISTVKGKITHTLIDNILYFNSKINSKKSPLEKRFFNTFNILNMKRIKPSKIDIVGLDQKEKTILPTIVRSSSSCMGTKECKLVHNERILPTVLPVDTVIKYTTDDAYVDNENVDTNYGGSKLVYITRADPAAGMSTTRGYFKFDLSDIPVNAMIEDVKIKLYIPRYVDLDSGEKNIKVYRCIENWSENSITWNTQPSLSTTASYSGFPPTYPTWWIIESDQLRVDVQNFVNGTWDNYGWCLRHRLDGPLVGLRVEVNSKEATENRPYIEITYSLPNNPPNPPSDPSPYNGATGIGTNPILSVYVEDPDGDSMDVTFYDGNGNKIGTDYDVSSGSRASVTWSGLEYDTTYHWFVIADDGIDQTIGPRNGIWSFTTGSGNHDPVLTVYDDWADGVEPDVGDLYTTTFTFMVHYYDPDGDNPSNIQVVIDEKSYNMEGSGSNANYTKKIDANDFGEGTHYYYFYCEDGHGGSDRLPSSGEWSFRVKDEGKNALEFKGIWITIWLWGPIGVPPTPVKVPIGFLILWLNHTLTQQFIDMIGEGATASSIAALISAFIPQIGPFISIIISAVSAILGIEIKYLQSLDKGKGIKIHIVVIAGFPGSWWAESQ